MATYPDLLIKQQVQTKPYLNQLRTNQARNIKYKQGYRLTTKTLSTKKITFANKLLALSINEIPDLNNLSKSAGKTLNINKILLKLTGNILSKIY